MVDGKKVWWWKCWASFCKAHGRRGRRGGEGDEEEEVGCEDEQIVENVETEENAEPYNFPDKDFWYEFIKEERKIRAKALILPKGER